MGKHKTTIISLFGIIISSAFKWFGGLMDILDLPNLGQKINNFSEKIGPGYWPYIYIGFFLFLILIVNWSDVLSFFKGQSAKSDEVSTAEPTTRESPAILKVERDVWLLIAVHYIAYGSWKFIEIPLDEDHITAGHQALDEIRQKAFDGELTVWGRIGQGPLFKQIQKEHWEDHGFESLSFIVNKPEDYCTKYYGNESDYTIYNSLMTSKAKVEELWPTSKLLTHDQLTFKVTKDKQDKLFLAVVAVRTKVLNHESFDACKNELIESCKYLHEHEAIFEGSKYKQDYKDFMHAAGIAIDSRKQYFDKDEKEYVLNLMCASSKRLEEALK